MINEIIAALKLPNGYLIHTGHECYCCGPDSHNLGILAPIDGTDFIAVGNPLDEKMFTIDPSQTRLDSTLFCTICNAQGATL
jgi:hypothetical protein